MNETDLFAIFTIPALIFLYLIQFKIIMDRQRKEWIEHHKTHYYINRTWVPIEKFKNTRVDTDWLDRQ